MLRDALVQTPANAAEAHAQRRMGEMHDLIELVTTWFIDVQKLEAKTLVKLMKLGARVVRLLEAKNQLKAIVGGRVDKVAGKAADKVADKGADHV
jgi:DNA-binding transcriptional regulator GbsR (MarR family)